MKDLFDLLGRILLSFIFLYEAYDNIAYANKNKAAMQEYGIHWNPELLLTGATALLVLGGLMLLLGYRMRLGAILLLLYWLPMTLIVHDFWKEAIDSDLRRWEALLFMKNIAITGGLLIAAGHSSSGKYAVKRLFATARVR